MMFHQPGDHLPRHICKAILVCGIGQHIVAMRIVQAEIDVENRCLPFHRAASA